MAPKTMKAVICNKVGGPVTIEDVDVPTPGPREVRIKLIASSLCSTDLSVIDGAFGHAFLPVILGHEAVGVVEELGREAHAYGFKVGQLVGAPPYSAMCLQCYDCKTFGPQFCPKKKVNGITAPGYFSEYSVVDAASAVIVSESMESDTLRMVGDVRRISPIFCAGVTVWDAIERAKLGPGQTVAIFGVGGLGQLGIRYASALGAKVLALDIHDEQLKVAKGQGLADEIINVNGLNGLQVAAKVREVNDRRRADAVIVTTGVPAAYQTALFLVEPQGRLIVVGLPKEPISWDARLISANNIIIIGARIPGQDGSHRCLKFSLRRNIFPPVNGRLFKLEDVNEMVALMKEGKVSEGRMVVQF